MTKDVYELTTEDLLSEEPVRPKLPTAQTRSSISVTPASANVPKASQDKPKFVPAALSRPIKEKSRTQSQEKPLEGGSSGMIAKAAAFYEEALEAQRAGDAAAAIRHVKMAMTFNPKEPKYQELLSKLGR